MEKHDGGPAFPLQEQMQPACDGGNAWLSAGQSGMSLRDYFAAKAMAALLSQMTYGNHGQHCAMYDPNDPAQGTTLSFLAYQAADAMLSERMK